MSKAKDHSLTPTELEIMNVLWETGPANVQTIQQRLPRELAYTTVQTMLNILHRKGKVRRSLKRRAYFYKAVVSRLLRYRMRERASSAMMSFWLKFV